MSRNPMSKLSASLLVLVMALAALVVLPGPNQGQALGTNDIYVPVVSGGIPVSGATVTLTNVHTGEVIQATPSGGLYRAVGAPSGYYRVDVTAGAYYDAVDIRGIQFPGTASYTVSPQIQMTKFPTASYSWNVTVVTSADQTPIQGARVSFYDDAAHEKVATDTGPTGIQGYTTIVMFPTLSPNMYLTVEADGFETNATAQTVSGSRSITVWLEEAGVISGLVTNSDGSRPATTGVVAYALDDDTSQPWIKRLLKSEGLSPYFVFNAKVGDTYTVCVDAPGLAADVSQLVATSEVQYLTKNLTDQTQRTEQVHMALADGYGSFDYSMATVLSYDDAIPGMNYSDIGSLRMQIDLGGFEVPANGDLSVTEIGRFTAKLTGYGVAHPTSGRLLTINNTLYSSGVPAFGSLTGLAAGSVISTDGVSYSYTSTYAVVGSVDASAPDYMMNATAMLDSPSVHHVNNITLPGLYEAVQNYSAGGHVDVTGYHPWVVLSSEEGSSVTDLVQVWIEKSLKPTVKGGIDTDLLGVYAVEVNGTITKYIVKVGANITFDASDSVDPNGNPLTYMWDFMDGTTVTTKNKTVVHKFTSASVLRHVVLNVSDVSLLWNVTELNVTCDGLDPTPVITFLNKTVNVTDNSITVNQREGFVLNATDSLDDVEVAGDALTALGIIDYVEFDYGDGNTSGRIPWSQDEQNASHAYASAGDFDLTLNVTDVVGHWKNTTIVVHVNDTTEPVVSYTVKNATGGTSLIENKTIVFDANFTTDNLDNVSLMYFSWYFGDGTWLNGTGAEGMLNVTHNYTRIGAVTVSLNVTDLNGNYLKTPKVITISQGPRPNVRIDRVYYEPGNFTEGESGYIIVNMTNTGSAAANNVMLYIYQVNADGTEKLLTTWNTFLNGSLEVDVVEVGGKVQAKIPWTFDNKGTYTFKLNVTSQDQLSANKYTASGDLALHVNEAGWKKILLWGGVAAVIILVPLAIYLSRKWSKREKKGPRREKKVEKEKDEDL